MYIHHYYTFDMLQNIASCIYRIAGKFGMEFNLAEISETAKFNSADCSTFVMKQWMILGFHQIKIRQMLRIGETPNLPTIRYSINISWETELLNNLMIH